MMAQQDGDGFSGQNLFQNVRSCQAYTFDDVLLLPGPLPRKIT
jgi:hypothetical protein